MFQIRNLSKKYNNEYALQNVSLDIGRGMNFIVGSSGSGKTTLLKIISGMESGYDGSAKYSNREISSLTENEKSAIYSSVIGFVSQDVFLIEEYTVWDNLLEPLYIKSSYSNNKMEKVLAEIGISHLKDKKVKLLSGGEKQRVQIARELLKNPEVIVCDEPTSALDSESATAVINLLRKISKKISVVVVTHDTKLIASSDNVIELDKGELVSKVELSKVNNSKLKLHEKNSFNFKNAVKRSKVNAKRSLPKFGIVVVAILLSSILLLSSLSGIINQSGQDEYDKLIDTYGNSLFDVSVVGSFMSASGGSEDNPDVDVDQDISGLYDKYVGDERLSSILISQSYDNIVINLDDKEYPVKFSGNSPVYNELLSGRHTAVEGFEVIVPESFVKQVGKTNESILGETINFKSTVNKWNGPTFTEMPTEIEVTIVGVFDSTITIFRDNPEENFDVEITDSFFMNLNANKEIRKQGELEVDKISFIMRGNTAEDVISIKNELNKDGIVPLGRFEILEDIVKINEQVKEQTSSATIVIGILSIFSAIAIMLVVLVLRKREYAILKISGYNNKNLTLISAVEGLGIFIVSLVLFLALSPVWNMVTMALFGASIMGLSTLFVGVAIILGVSALYVATSVVVSKTVRINKVLKGGSK